MNPTIHGMTAHLTTLRDNANTRDEIARLAGLCRGDVRLRETEARNARRALNDYAAEYRARGYTIEIPDTGKITVTDPAV